MERCFRHKRTTKIPNSLRFCTDWSRPSLSTLCIINFLAVPQFSVNSIGIKSRVLRSHAQSSVGGKQWNSLVHFASTQLGLVVAYSS